MKRMLGLFLVWLAWSAGADTTNDIRRDAVVNTIERVMPAVVNIATETIVQTRHPLDELLREFYDPYYRRQPQRQYSLGSGVIIDEDGYVVTNDHVVRRASRISVKLMDGREYDCDRVATSAKSDVALLKIRGKAGEKFAAAKFAQDDDLLLGETVIAMGNPFGLGGSVSRGILSAKSRRPAGGNEPLDVADWLQVDAPINPGNSGGPLINLRGELIGINVAVYREGQGIGFAIPIKLVSEALAASFTPEALKQVWFGARVKVGAFPLVITTVEPGSPADQAGVKSGDVLQQVNGHVPSGFIEFNHLVMNAGDKTNVVLHLQRNGTAKTVTVRPTLEQSFFNEKLIQRRLGVSVQPLTEEIAESLGFNRLDGLLVGGVDRNSTADKAGLERGMLITSVDGLAPGNLVELARHLHSKKAGDSVNVQLLFPRRRGSFITLQQFQLALKLQ
ncbi:MAG: trypsin-like peptidase domain-containing protein [Verrucomicrobiota bacterium]